jgi:hypothetical protein
MRISEAIGKRMLMRIRSAMGSPHALRRRYRRLGSVLTKRGPDYIATRGKLLVHRVSEILTYGVQ